MKLIIISFSILVLSSISYAQNTASCSFLARAKNVAGATIYSTSGKIAVVSSIDACAAQITPALNRSICDISQVSGSPSAVAFSVSFIVVTGGVSKVTSKSLAAFSCPLKSTAQDLADSNLDILKYTQLSEYLHSVGTPIEQYYLLPSFATQSSVLISSAAANFSYPFNYTIDTFRTPLVRNNSIQNGIQNVQSLRDRLNSCLASLPPLPVPSPTPGPIGGDGGGDGGGGDGGGYGGGDGGGN